MAKWLSFRGSLVLVTDSREKAERFQKYSSKLSPRALKYLGSKLGNVIEHHVYIGDKVMTIEEFEKIANTDARRELLEKLKYASTEPTWKPSEKPLIKKVTWNVYFRIYRDGSLWLDFEKFEVEAKKYHIDREEGKVYILFKNTIWYGKYGCDMGSPSVIYDAKIVDLRVFRKLFGEVKIETVDDIKRVIALAEMMT